MYVPSFLLLSCRHANLLKTSQHAQIFHKASTSSRKRKRGQIEQKTEHSFTRSPRQRFSKRLQISPSSRIDKKASHQALTNDVSEDSIDPLQYWIQTGKWRKQYFEQDSQVKEDFERGKSPEELRRRD